MEPFTGEIRAFAFPYAPRNWAACNGLVISIQQNTALFAVIGATYGGNGTTTFGLPNLNGNIAMGVGQSAGGSDWSLGRTAGASTVTLTQAQMAGHNHALQATQNQATSRSGVGNQLALASTGDLDNPYDALIYVNASPTTSLGAPSLATVGGNAAHTNAMPSLVLNYCICMAGVFPSYP